MIQIVRPVITTSISFGINALVRNKKNNICIWFKADHKIANKDKLVKLIPTENKAVAAVAPWMDEPNDFAVSDAIKPQSSAVFFLTFSLIIVWAGSVIPETVERILKL